MTVWQAVSYGGLLVFGLVLFVGGLIGFVLGLRYAIEEWRRG